MASGLNFLCLWEEFMFVSLRDDHARKFLNRLRMEGMATKEREKVTMAANSDG